MGTISWFNNPDDSHSVLKLYMVMETIPAHIPYVPSTGIWQGFSAGAGTRVYTIHTVVTLAILKIFSVFK